MRSSATTASSSGRPTSSARSIDCALSVRRTRPDAERLRLFDAVALRVVDADLAQALQDLIVLDEFRDRLLFHHVADVIDRLDHRTVDRIDQHISYEAAIDLEKVHGQMLQITERGHAGAEIVQRKPAAEIAQLADEARRLRQIGDRGRLSDFEADRVARNVA